MSPSDNAVGYWRGAWSSIAGRKPALAGVSSIQRIASNFLCAVTQFIGLLSTFHQQPKTGTLWE